MEVADKVVIMNHGRVEQIDTPAEIYDNPASEFVLLSLQKKERRLALFFFLEIIELYSFHYCLPKSQYQDH